MESFYRTHDYLLEHLEVPVRRILMDEINWDDRLIGIKGSRGVGKTTFLLAYAKERFGAGNRECLYMNLNQFYFTERSILDFAREFRDQGGKVLLLDQVFKYPDWSKELRACYDRLPDLKIIFTGSSVMRLTEENPDLNDRVVSYNLRGFSFREYLNLTAGTNFPVYELDTLLDHHADIARQVEEQLSPANYFRSYLHHGYYPFYLEKRNFSENLLKTMNMMLEVDVLYIKQIEQRYLPKLRRLLYILATQPPSAPNVSQLSKDIETSRATVMNYIKYLTDARLTNLLYREGETFPKKPAKVYMNNTNLMYPIRPGKPDEQALRETFFYNMLHKGHKLNLGLHGAQFRVDGAYDFCVLGNPPAEKGNASLFYAVDRMDLGRDRLIPLWLFGFLY
ncbi:MAG: AAA family ATPase [Tannerella sp.]|jgi:predicted AAA+ superfamily ATPase|nr:AAA family ATPase [Tannerella sp.]